eukprot:Plantae.Rhodophyta-Hildenbrandia_rubra.ctg1913.p1 GENE.Plantae.Rhodophyta-Hildenbrandia_rubra.ctg1913~~Plantae.Rhodophyta-Hildenbrandia_rubra.ctg1913.p1  ORF type:complete len:817 (+),score=114.44 Plantae.Rhodophyta-Hildenbrandia_rubra.ctg1913:146-2596(+)
MERLKTPSFLSWILVNTPHPFLPSPTPQVQFKPFTHGQSNHTILVTLSSVSDGQPLYFSFVVRLPPSTTVDNAKRTAHRMDWEYELITALENTSVPVPQTYALCTDLTVLGCVFYAMECVKGRVFKDPGFPELAPLQRRMAYVDFVDVLSKLHSVDVLQLRIDRLTKKVQDGSAARYLNSQRNLWMRRVKGADAISLGQKLERELNEAEFTRLQYEAKPCLVHGDWRIDNVMWHPKEPKIVAVLDWELASVGLGSADLATCCSPYWIGPDASGFEAVRSIEGIVGIPPEKVLVSLYNNVGDDKREVTSNEMRVLIAFSNFRMAGILFGVEQRRGTGLGELAHRFARQGLQVLESHNSESKNVTNREHASWDGQRDWCETRSRNVRSSSMKKVVHTGLSMTSGQSMTFRETKATLLKFMREEILPRELDFDAHCNSNERWNSWPPMESLKTSAKKVGLWNLWLPSHLGGRFTNLQYSSLAEVMGRCIFFSEACNSSPPDTGNMEILLRYGTSAQKERWLWPLLKGEIRSCFGMTEPFVASSDPLNLSTNIERTRDGHYKINGRKWWTSGAMDPRTKLIILIAKGPTSQNENTSKSKHQQHTILLIPIETKGVKIRRALTVYGYDDSPHGHAEIDFENVLVKCEESVLYKEGRGFEVAQSRLGAGRIHHCMRAIGMAERAYEMMIQRALSREAFGDKLINLEGTRTDISKSRCEIEQARLLTRAAAQAMDDNNLRRARTFIAMAKIVVPTVACNVIDRSIQTHGGLGVSQDTVLARLWAQARSLRIADGPDAVHMRSLAKQELMRLTKEGKLLATTKL